MQLEALIKKIENETGLRAIVKDATPGLFHHAKSCELVTLTNLSVLDIRLASDNGYNWFPMPDINGSTSFFNMLWKIYNEDSPEVI